MALTTRLKLSLLIMRLSIGAFLLVWASLKFYRPEWMGNVFRRTYKMTWLKKDVGFELLGVEFGFVEIAYAVGSLQVLIVLLFIAGLWRTPVYAIVTLMHGTGITGAALGGALWRFTSYPQNLLWTSVATLGALVALFILRRHDGYTIDGFRKRNSP
ncbi:MAG: hypothetical protein ABJM29_03605 [Rhizobiaceae bacterium]